LNEIISEKNNFNVFNFAETKNQFARDDPAFLALLSSILVISSLLFGLVMQLSFFNLLKFVLWVVLIDCIAVGCFIASIYWFVSNKFLLKKSSSSDNIDVEWAYCFDVHLNAFLPLITVLHVFQLPFIMSKKFLILFESNSSLYNFFIWLIALINHDWYLSAIIGNTFWLVAISYYFYILFLGFSGNHIRITIKL